MLSSNSVPEFAHPERVEAYRRLREGPPIAWSAKDAAWVLTRYNGVSSILRHPAAQAVQAGQFFDELDRRGNLGLAKLKTGFLSISFFLRPPRHDHIRRIFAQLLGNFRRTGLPDTLADHIDAILSGGRTQGQIELVCDFAREIALCSIAAILGLPVDGLRRLARQGTELIAIFDRIPPSVARLKKLNGAAEIVLSYFTDAISERRLAPRNDGLSQLISQAGDSGLCSDEEIAGLCGFFFFAGVVTTAAALSDCALCLLSNFQLRRHLSQYPDVLPSFSREILRLSSPVKYVARELQADCEIADKMVRAGDQVMLMLGVANRDPEVYPNPDALDLDRGGPEPLTFAAGPYRCLGGQLATFEIELAAKKLLECRSLRWNCHPLAWEQSANIAGLRYLNGLFGDEGDDDGK
jgi:hypothetical protein